jgi:hypothetical protein
MLVKRVVLTRLRTRPSPPVFRVNLAQLAKVSLHFAVGMPTPFALLVWPDSSVLVEQVPVSGVVKENSAPRARSLQDGV